MDSVGVIGCRNDFMQEHHFALTLIHAPCVVKTRDLGVRASVSSWKWWRKRATTVCFVKMLDRRKEMERPSNVAVPVRYRRE